MYLEHCPAVFMRAGTFYPASEVRDRTGYRSVYYFSEDDAQEIIASHSSAGLKKYCVGSYELIVDFDGEQCDNIPKLLDTLRSWGLGYELWSSGGKGYHVVFHHQPVYSSNLPLAQAQFLQNLGVVSDPSLYRPSSLIRLPGTIHEKTGKQKTLVEKVEGCFMVIDFSKVTRKENPRPTFADGDPALLALALESLSYRIGRTPLTGKRHTTIWGSAKDLLRSGLSYNTVLELLVLLNNTWDNPKSADEVRNAVDQAANQLNKR